MWVKTEVWLKANPQQRQKSLKLFALYRTGTGTLTWTGGEIAPQPHSCPHDEREWAMGVSRYPRYRRSMTSWVRLAQSVRFITSFSTTLPRH